MASGVDLIVAAPPLLPPRTGLIRAATLVEVDGPDTDYALGDPDGLESERWLRGVTWRPESSLAPAIQAICAGSYPTVGARLAPGEALPFDVSVADQCSSIGWTQQEYRERALRALLAKEQWAVEREFEQAASVMTNNHLTLSDGSTTTLEGGASLRPEDAIAALDQAIADAAIGQGMVHMSAFLTVLCKGKLLISEDAGRLVTPNGNIVVPGNGYQGKGPGNVNGTTGVSGGEAMWAYATDPVVVMRTRQPTFWPDTMTEALDRAHNTVTFWSERPYAILWSRLLHAAVKVATSIDVVEDTAGERPVAVHAAAAGTTDVQLVTGAGRLSSVAFRETAGATASFVLRDGTDATGTLLVPVNLNASESDRPSFENPIPFSTGLYLDRVTGTTEVTAFTVGP